MSAQGSPQEKRTGLSLRRWILVAGSVTLVALALSSRRRPAPQAHAEASATLPTRLQPEEITAAEADHDAPAVSAFRREVERPKPVENVAAAAATRDEDRAPAPPGGPLSRKRDEKKTLPEIFRMPAMAAPETAAKPADDAPKIPAPRGAPQVFAPFGRLIKCQLVDTLDSVTARSEPIVAIVTQDLDWDGNVIIPAGSEAFSYAAAAPVIDGGGVGRLVDNGEWTLVLPGVGDLENGRELALRGRAVNRQEYITGERGSVRSWGPDDGADGLVGYTLSTLDSREIRLFAAAAISGMAQGLSAVAERQVPAPGVSGVLGATQVAPTLGNAAIGSLGTGAVDAVNEIASRIREEISKRGVYVRVPAGKEFYLFVEQTIDPGMAEVGLRLPHGGKNP
ncbi:MAG TPA: TrbI/VirB10 family protein [Opitutaceae bacterium]